ncbi:hypothetical protein [Halorientalis sp.]|jgi:hypothetical protein|uniref:hypothetical protein n=1 Tax=Halorientalis sp. TaxID=1931229 RepID=UPI002636F9C3|nr:hypothetical protein [Halorientalis sp.]
MTAYSVELTRHATRRTRIFEPVDTDHDSGYLPPLFELVAKFILLDVVGCGG